MSNRMTCGLAFPGTRTETNYRRAASVICREFEWPHGMTLRDWFAKAGAGGHAGYWQITKRTANIQDRRDRVPEFLRRRDAGQAASRR